MANIENTHTRGRIAELFEKIFFRLDSIEAKLDKISQSMGDRIDRIDALEATRLLVRRDDHIEIESQIQEEDIQVKGYEADLTKEDEIVYADKQPEMHTDLLEIQQEVNGGKDVSNTEFLTVNPYHLYEDPFDCIYYEVPYTLLVIQKLMIDEFVKTCWCEWMSTITRVGRFTVINQIQFLEKYNIFFNSRTSFSQPEENDAEATNARVIVLSPLKKFDAGALGKLAEAFFIVFILLFICLLIFV